MSEAATSTSEARAESGKAAHYDAISPDMPAVLRFSEALRKLVDRVGRFGSWMFLPLVLITVFDVVLRKIGVQYFLTTHLGRIFDSTVLQELEWHFHTGLFALVLGYGYIWNTHVRVDLIREHLDFRKKAWMEFLGLTIFLIPYCSIVIWFASIYAYDSWAMNEISASTVGLTHRWIIKSVLVFGLVMAVVAGVAVWLQVVIVLWGPQNIRFPLMTLEWPEEAGTRLEGKTRLELDEMEDELERRERERREAEEKQAGAGAQTPPGSSQ
ncbi:MAG: TRAP transporter small permease subunit [Gammaproteobacteria bacterium]|nr:TRAP transporter small permease subunit [Gammaproteobacteria bacterium]NIM72267.1 TRAP transporter small permease subunit [Gammaproteobacteria bacterium]NIN39182.1 TRAP transporter small permease subunit [Gammaproteobacteria bacterium]NIO24015.1 TRAP transporter small permease subunit [Gammaproteobacteria bacterium]NIO64667.1 TRAP transporter small permease subunit [Gammaproteobacteria bacterium]